MPGPSSRTVTRLLAEWRNGDHTAFDRLMPLVYDELRERADCYMRGERSGHTLQPTALVHEAYLRLMQLKHIVWQDRVHFFAVAARMMRRILVDYARRRRSRTPGMGNLTISLEVRASAKELEPELLSLDESLKRLESTDPRKCQIVEFKFFGGLTNKECAQVLRVSETTVEREWRLARAWLVHEIR